MSVSFARVASLVGVVALCFAASPLAAQPKRVSNQNGIHKGLISASPNGAGDSLGLMCQLDLSYALWTLLGEPVQDFLFRWQACKPEDAKLPELGMTFKEVKRQYPQLAKQLDAIKPLSVRLRAVVQFYESEAGGSPFAKGELDIEPDLYEVSGKPETFSVPESPNWNDWFADFQSWAPATPISKRVYGYRGERCSTMCPSAERQVRAACEGGQNRFAMTGCNCSEGGASPYATLDYTCGDGKGLANAFSRAKRVEISEVRVTHVTWTDVYGVVSAVTYEQDKAMRAAARKQPADAFWGQPDGAAMFAGPVSRPSFSGGATPGSGETHKKPLKAKDKFTGPLVNNIIRDASQSDNEQYGIHAARDRWFGVQVSPVASWQAVVDGASRELVEDRVPLDAGKHHVALSAPGSTFVFDVDCSSREYQTERSDHRIILYTSSDSTAEPERPPAERPAPELVTVVARACQLSSVTFEAAK